MSNDNDMLITRIQGIPAGSLMPEEAAALDGNPNVIRGVGGSNAIEGIPPKKHISTPDGKVTYLLPKSRDRSQ